MKIVKVSENEFLKTAFAPADTNGSAADAGPVDRDGKYIADALSSSAKGLGLSVTVIPSGIDGKSYAVFCDGRPGADGKSAIKIKFDVHGFGDMEGSIESGMQTHGMGVVKVMRQIVANAVQESGIAAIPTNREIDPILVVNPNYYVNAAKERQGQKQAVPEAI
jgi:hypothetical protein